jgi:hypothetical protein
MATPSPPSWVKSSHFSRLLSQLQKQTLETPTTATFHEIHETLSDIIALQSPSTQKRVSVEEEEEEEEEKEEEWKWEGTQCYETKDKGKGVKAIREFKKGECIIRVEREEMVDVKKAKKAFGK